ncbi:MAG: methylmalonyl-CoA mutase family protein [Bacilli bacterium]
MKNEKKLFAEFKPSTYEEWYAEAVKLLKGAPFDKKMYTNTPEGITLKPIYNKEDMTFDVSLPGYDDYVRGTKIEGNKGQPWKISQEICAALPEDFNKKILEYLNKGQNSVEIVLDDPSANTTDADNSSDYKVGHRGAKA